MGRGKPLGYTSTLILQALSRGLCYGLEIIDQTELAGGTVYKLLSRMEDSGLVRSRWEDHRVAEAERRPRRRYYSLTKDGRGRLEDSLAEYRRLFEFRVDTSATQEEGGS